MTRKSFLAALFAPLLAKFVPKLTAMFLSASEKRPMLVSQAMMDIILRDKGPAMSLFNPNYSASGTVVGDTVNIRLPYYVKKSNLDNSIRT